jgi:exosortase A-associated hydrolase 1
VSFSDIPVVFDCEGDRLVGILSLPASPLGVGVVVVVGGPQYRAGSHRQFVQLSRSLAIAGIACLRFDYRGMGDSEGSPRNFDTVDSDIECAVEELRRRVPQVRQVVLWGLCDGASAAFIALSRLPGVGGVIALNPWVRSETSLNKAIVQRYYVQRVASREFWTKLLGGKLALRRSAGELFRRLSAALGGASGTSDQAARALSYHDRMSDGLERFAGPVLIVLSGKDLTAQEYVVFSESNARWKSAILGNTRLATEDIAEADHTFSNSALRAKVEHITTRFVLALGDSSTASEIREN